MDELEQFLAALSEEEKRELDRLLALELDDPPPAAAAA
jgi:hypothetical protein